MVLARFSICQDWAAPLEIISTSLAGSSPAFLAKFMPSARPWTRPAMQIWLTILVSWPAPTGAHQDAGPGVGIDHRLGAVEVGRLAADHDRELAVLGAGLAAGDRRVEEVAAPCPSPPRAISRATSAEAVVWSTKMAPLPCRRRRRRRPDDAAHVVVVADAGEDDLGALGRLGRRRGGLAAMRRDPVLAPWPRCGCRPSPRARPSPGGPPSGSPSRPDRGMPFSWCRLPWFSARLQPVDEFAARPAGCAPSARLPW